MPNLLFRGSTVALLILLALSACRPTASKQSTIAGSTSPESVASVMTDHVNYSHERGMKYTLYDLSKQPPVAVGGAIVDRLAAGGEKGCCLALPKTWKPGMKVRVQWNESDRKEIYPEVYVRDLEIPRYDRPADLFVVFHPAQDVELVVSAAEPGHPNWGGRIKQTPWEWCLENEGRKPCKAALPKLFDTSSSKGMCTLMKEENYPNHETLCLSAMQDCMRDFEDEPFCKEILWASSCANGSKDDQYCIEKARKEK